VEKLKMTIPQFSKTLAQSFQKYSIVPLIKEYIEEVEETNKSWRFDLTSKKDKKSILKEWIILELFFLGQEVLEYFKGNQIGNDIVGSLNYFCADNFIKYKIFSGNDKFEELLTYRYTYYLKTLKDSEPNDIFLLSKNILNQLYGEKSNIIYATAIVKYYFDTSSMDRKLIIGLMKEIDLI
jgi:hypothetical protein